MAKKVVIYNTSEPGSKVSARWESGPAVRVGKKVVWIRPDGKGGKR